MGNIFYAPQILLQVTKTTLICLCWMNYLKKK